MSAVRFWVGNIIGLLVAIAAGIFSVSFGVADGFFTGVFFAYIALSVVALLIWWCGPGIKVFYVVTILIGATPVSFAHNLLSCGSFLSFLGLFLLFPCIGFFLGCLAMGIVLVCIISMFLYPYYLFALWSILE